MTGSIKREKLWVLEKIQVGSLNSFEIPKSPWNLTEMKIYDYLANL